MNEQRYPSDLTDDQYAAIEPLLPLRGGEGKVGRPPRYTNRQLLNGIFYALRTGCAWRYLPHDLPHWTSVYACWKRWSIDGTMDRIHDALRRLSYQTHARDEAGGARGRGRGGAPGAAAGASGGGGGDTPLAGMKGGRTSRGRAAQSATRAATGVSAGDEQMDRESLSQSGTAQEDTSLKTRTVGGGGGSEGDPGGAHPASGPEAE